MNLRKLAVCGAAALAASTFGLNTLAEVTVTRSLDMDEVDSGVYEMRCLVEYSGIDATRDWIVNLRIIDVAANYVTVPLGGQVGPTNKRLKLSESGVWRFSAVLTNNSLRVERIYYFSYQPTVGSQFVCEGWVVDATTGEQLQGILMSDSFGKVD